MAVAPDWLLLLGSRRADDALLGEALHRLAACGLIEPLTANRPFPDASGSGEVYFNALVRWRTTLTEAQRRARLKQIERELGRERAAVGEVPIDIDVLASARLGEPSGWAADAHALAKGEFAHRHVRALLREAGIDSLCADAGRDG